MAAGAVYSSRALFLLVSARLAVRTGGELYFTFLSGARPADRGALYASAAGERRRVNVIIIITKVL